jgi:hypothetical protein
VAPALSGKELRELSKLLASDALEAGGSYGLALMEYATDAELEHYGIDPNTYFRSFKALGFYGNRFLLEIRTLADCAKVIEIAKTYPEWSAVIAPRPRQEACSLDKA